MSKIKIIAIDQASINTAYSVWSDSKLIRYNMLIADKKIKSHARIRQMSIKIAEMIESEKPDFVIFEDCQLQAGNAATFQVLCQLQGMIMSKLYDMGLPFGIVRPSVWKSYLGVAKGKRDVQKANTIKKIEEMYSLDLADNDDIADAIGIGHYAINNLVEV